MTLLELIPLLQDLAWQGHGDKEVVICEFVPPNGGPLARIAVAGDQVVLDA